MLKELNKTLNLNKKFLNMKKLPQSLLKPEESWLKVSQDLSSKFKTAKDLKSVLKTLL